MTDDPTLPKGYGRWWNKNRIVLVAALAASSIMGPIFAQGIAPLEKEIKMISRSTYTIHQEYGEEYSITYSTTGPVLRDFWMSCGPIGYPDFGPHNNCIIIPYDGNAGVVELAMPTGLVREFDGLLSQGSIGEVQGSWYKKLAFERVSEDSSYTRYQNSTASRFEPDKDYRKSIKLDYRRSIRIGIRGLLCR